MKIKYMGKFDGNEESLPRKPHRPGAVPFKEAEDANKLALIANGFAILILIVLGVPLFFTGWFRVDDDGFLLGALMSLVCAIPHEYLHAICFKETAYVYTYLEKGVLFVVEPEDMSKGRFIFMSLLPSIVFGLIPYIAGILLKNVFLTSLGVFSLSMGAGDYYNVFNALTQMPEGAKTYLYGFHSWWYR